MRCSKTWRTSPFCFPFVCGATAVYELNFKNRLTCFCSKVPKLQRRQNHIFLVHVDSNIGEHNICKAVTCAIVLS